jgi:hypothetical protein
MANIEFDEDVASKKTQTNAGFRTSIIPSKTVNFLLKHGIIKNETQANTILVAFVVVCIGITVYLFNGAASGPIRIDPDLVNSIVTGK